MADRICVVDGCEKSRHQKARMCSMHIARKARHGDVHHDRAATVQAQAEARFWSKVDKTPTCWLWTGWLNHGGYGWFRVKFEGYRGASAHRFAWLVSGRGPIPEGMQLDHLCRVRNCVRPDHLEIVTPQENTLRGETLPAINASKVCCPKCGGDYAIAKRGHRKPGRWCPPCHSERRRQRKAEQREAA